MIGAARQRIYILLGIGFMFLALFFPLEGIAGLMKTIEPQDRYLGLTILRLGLGLNGLILIAWPGIPGAFFNRPGIPASVLGLRLRNESDDAKSSRWPVRSPLGIILVSGSLLRVAGLNRDLWLDEIATVTSYLRLPAGEILYTYFSPNQHLLYSLLGSISFSLFGESAWSARLPAFLFGMGSLAGLYYLARRLMSDREALFATLFMTVNYHHLWFSQNARGYTGMIFWTVVSTALFLRGLNENKTRIWLAYIASMVLGIMTLQNMVFVFLGHFAAYHITLPRWPAWRTQHWPLTLRIWIVGGGVALLTIEAHSLVLPQIIKFFAAADRTGLGSNIESPAGLILLFWEGFASSPVGIVGLLGTLILMGSGWLSFWRQSPLVASLMALPPLFGLSAVILLNYGAFPRAFLYVLPLAMLIAVRGGLVLGRALAQYLLPAGRPRQLGQAYFGLSLVGVMIIVSTASLYFNYRYPKQDFTGAMAYIEANRSPTDVVTAVGLAASSYPYYTNHFLYPQTMAELRALTEADQTVWAVYTLTRDLRLRFPDIFDFIEEDFELVKVFPGTLGDGTIYVTRHRAHPGS